MWTTRYINKDKGDNGRKPSNEVTNIAGTKIGSLNGAREILRFQTLAARVSISLVPDNSNERNVAGTSQQLKPNVQQQELYKTINMQ
jgi:hypothetical protein